MKIRFPVNLSHVCVSFALAQSCLVVLAFPVFPDRAKSLTFN